MLLKLTKRNILVFVRNRRAMVLAAVSLFLIIALFAIFLGRMYTEWVTGIFGVSLGVRYLVDSWIIAGVLEINTAVIALSVLGTMVQDTETACVDDFLVAPFSRKTLMLSHYLAALALGLVYSLAGLLAGEAYIVLAGGQWLEPAALAKAAGLLALCALSSTSIMFFIVSFIRSASVYGSFNSLFGTFIGFAASVYIPIGVFPDAVQKVMSALPFGMGSAALRSVFCAQALQSAFGAAPPELTPKFEKMYGLRLFWGDAEITFPAIMAVLAVTILLFGALSALRLKSYKRA